jgi:bifunctional enzyme CysN/CysC
MGSANFTQRGVTVWLTGLPAAGKTTVALLAARSLAYAGRRSYVIDGDAMRAGLNADLGFSMADRTENVRRIAHVARMMAEAGIIAIVPVITPLRAQRAFARTIHEERDIEFFEVYVSTPLSVCEERDPKGLYGLARAGQIKNFTGFDSPYEEPECADLILRPPSSPADQASDVLALISSAISLRRHTR